MGRVGALKCPDCGFVVARHAVSDGNAISDAEKIAGCFLSPSEVQLLRHQIVARVASGR